MKSLDGKTKIKELTEEVAKSNDDCDILKGKKTKNSKMLLDRDTPQKGSPKKRHFELSDTSTEKKFKDNSSTKSYPERSTPTVISFGRKRAETFASPVKSQRNSGESNFQKKKFDASKFRYGNYHQYYGYRNKDAIDSRILCMKKEWFSGKDILDIGCNAGHFTLDIAQKFSPKCVIGVDIDSDLIKMATKNVRHYVDPEKISDEDFPLSFVFSFGPVAQSMDPRQSYPAGNFPFNVQFVQGNYILPSDELLDWQEPCFDTVLCLSLTKWIHLNWGDEGIKRLFRRIYAQLRPGGCLILEAQTFNTYAKKKKITETTLKNYNEIQLRPEMFNKYLLEEVQFVTCMLIDIPAHLSKGFKRPIYLFTKGGDVQKNERLLPKHIVYKDNSDDSIEDSDAEEFSD